MPAVWGQEMVRQAGDNIPSRGGAPQCLLSTVIPMHCSSR